MNEVLETADKMLKAFIEIVKDKTVSIVGVNMCSSDQLLNILSLWGKNLSLTA